MSEEDESELYVEALLELDKEFPGAAWDDSLRGFLQKKEKLENLCLKILLALAGPVVYFLLFLFFKEVPFKDFIILSSAYILTILFFLCASSVRFEP